jgi:hypothetical protein
MLSFPYIFYVSKKTLIEFSHQLESVQGASPLSPGGVGGGLTYFYHSKLFHSLFGIHNCKFKIWPMAAASFLGDSTTVTV